MLKENPHIQMGPNLERGLGKAKAEVNKGSLRRRRSLDPSAGKEIEMEHVRIPWKSWVVVCDGTKVLVFSNEGDADLLNLKPLDVRVEPEPPTHDLGTDRPGRVHQSKGSSRSAVEYTDLHAEAEAEFITKLAERLDKAAADREMTNVILIAPPKALGILRKHLSPSLQALVRGEIAKDLAQLSTAEIEKHLAA
jgi:protein required for attachment to host cells